VLDIFHHLPNYLLLISDKKQDVNMRPTVRIFSAKNKEAFTNQIQATSWTSVLNSNNANEAYNKFIEIITDSFNQNFKQQKLSRRRTKDQKLITSGLKKSSGIKNKLYKKWIQSRSVESEIKYKNYKTVLKKVSREAEALYYKELFDIKLIQLRNMESFKYYM
jgi:hypothetical protein